MKNNILLGVVVAMTIILSIASAIATTFDCYQETANKSTTGDGNCGLNYSGVYLITDGPFGVPSNLYDGNWSSFTSITIANDGFFYINYTTHNYNLINNVNWQVKTNNGTVNITLPQSCRERADNKLVLYAIDPAIIASGFSFYCWNNTDSTEIYRTAEPANELYEEAVIWTVADLREFANTYNNITYETAHENYSLNFTYDNIIFNGTPAVTLIYSGTQYPATFTNTNGNVLARVNRDIPAISGAQQNFSFYWQINLTNSTGTYFFNSSFANQTVNEFNGFNICGPFSNVTYLNISYRDETTNQLINGTVILSSWTYNIVGSSLTNTLNYVSPLNGGSQVVQLQHAFCNSPPFYPIYVSTATYQYGNPVAGYSTRTWPFRALSLTNSSTFMTLYLISLTDSGTTPVTFQAVSSQTSTVVSGVRISAYRVINGTETLVADGYTDDSGVVSYYLSPITSYRIVAFGGGCSSLTSTIVPSSSQYNLMLNCGTNASGFTTELDGITYQRTPADGLNTPGNINYTFYVSSSILNLTRVRFEIVDALTNVTLASNDNLTNIAGCTPSSCLLTLMYPAYTGDNIKARYYLAVNGTTDSDLILIEGDAYWRFIKINMTNSVNSIGRLMLNLQDFFNTWGASNDETTNCITLLSEATCNAALTCRWVNFTEWSPSESESYNSVSAMCIPRDDLNKIEFNRIVTIFFAFTVILFVMGKSTGYELNHPGSFVVGMSAIIWILSLYGMFTFSGLTSYEFFNKYIFALTTSCVAGGYAISVIRRYSG